MNFKQWMTTEGFRVNYNKLPSTLHPDNYDANLIQSRQKKSVIDQVYNAPESIVFDPLDQPQDFIKIETVNKVEQLNIPTRQQLPSFEGVQILYGFKFSAANEKIALESSKKVKELEAELAGLQNKKMGRNKEDQSRIIEIIKNCHDSIIRKVPDPSQLAKYLPSFVNRDLETAELLKFKNGQPQLWDMKMIQKVLNNSEVESTYSISKKVNEIKTEIQRLNDIIGSKGGMMNLIQQAFLKKIKHPQTPDDQQLCDHFVRLSVENYHKYRPNYPYEYVVYPQSSSALNTQIATGLAAQYGATAVQGFTKLMTPTIDTTNFIRNNPQLTPIKRAGAINKLSSQIASSKGQIKNIQNNRPYVRNWQMDPQLMQNVKPDHNMSGLTNRRILIIDDNAASSGTIQAIHKVLMSSQIPKSVHIYTPLFANFSH